MNDKNFETIKEIVEKQNAYSDELANIIINLYKYIYQKNWWGACHATASVLYVALKEKGLNPVLCIGEVRKGSHLFDHSWIELDGKIIDLAICMTMQNGMALNAPVILNIDLDSKQKHNIKYGVKVFGLNEPALSISKRSFNEYMDAYPDNKKGLWGIVETILNINIDIKLFKEKYKNVKRKVY